MQTRTRDQLAVVFRRRVQLIHNDGQKRLKQLREAYESMADEIINSFNAIVDKAAATQPLSSDGIQQVELDAQLGEYTRDLIETHGGIDYFRNNYELLSAVQNNNYLPLLFDYFDSKRSKFFRLVASLQIAAATNDRALRELVRVLRSCFGRSMFQTRRCADRLLARQQRLSLTMISHSGFSLAVIV